MAKYLVISSFVDLSARKMLAPGSTLEIDDKDKERIKKADSYVKTGVLQKAKAEPKAKAK